MGSCGIPECNNYEAGHHHLAASDPRHLYGHWSTAQLALKAMTKERDALLLQVEEYRKVLDGLFVAVPAIGHHDLPAYACPAHDLAQAMNAAAKKLNKPEPYPGARVVEKPKCECQHKPIPLHTGMEIPKCALCGEYFREKTKEGL